VLTADFHILSYPIASLLARLRGKAVIHWTHGTSLGGPKSPRKERIRRWIHKHLSHALLLYGSRERSYYISEGYCENDIFLTNNSLDTRQTIAIRDSVLPHETDDYRRRVGGRGPYFAYVGRLIKSKRVDLLIRAVPKMSEHYPGIRIVIIGDGPERVSLMELAKELDVLQHVVFEGPVYDDRQLAPMLLACDACVCPGSVGLIVNQAFVFGLPIVTSDDPWVHSPEIAMLESGVNGLRFNDGSAESLADALLRLVSCRQSLAAMKQAAMDTISNKYNENAVVTGFKDAIESACTKAGLLRRGSGHRRR
jgi:glycosyltransferase involved in cell wall biosynthesis